MPGWTLPKNSYQREHYKEDAGTVSAVLPSMYVTPSMPMEELFSMKKDLENVPWSTTIGHDDRSSAILDGIG